MEVIKQVESSEESVRKKFVTRVKRLGDSGYIMNTEHFRKITGSGCNNLWEIKLVSDQLRYFVYYDFDKRDKAVIFDWVKKTEKNMPQNTYKTICKKMKMLSFHQKGE
jgi:hypothetical protein